MAVWQGKPRRLAKDVHEVILAPIREHSRKPDEAYRRVERYCAGPYLDLFSRESRTGWDAWGDELGKFDQREATNTRQTVRRRVNTAGSSSSSSATL
jgi:N6-adenosine-specific RNA methylase IME4